jgi:coiled-coil domain-containing protein 55
VRAWQLNIDIDALFTLPPPTHHTPTMSFKFGLKVKNPVAKDTKKPAPGKRKPIFDDDEDVKGKGKAEVKDNGVEIAEFNFDDAVASTSASSKPSKPAPSSKSKGPPTGPPARKHKPKEDDPTTFVNLASVQEAERRAKEAMQVDASIYDYDAAYDALHAKSAIKAAAEKEDALQRRPKYMDNLIESTELRKKDMLRAKDKLLQREREAEGDEFADKDKFVTGAYKLQQEEARKAEEEEKIRQEKEEANRKKSGMQGFHRQMLMQEEKRHQEAMEAAAEAVKSGVPLVVEEPEEKSSTEIAKEMIKQGKNIIVNEDGQVADKRQLLSAGLNIVAKPKPAPAASTSSTRPDGSQLGLQGRSATQRAVRERQTQMVADQLAQVNKRAADEEAEEQRKLEHASKSRKTEDDISSAKERYLQRKREAEAAKAAAAAGK